MLQQKWPFILQSLGRLALPTIALKAGLVGGLRWWCSVRYGVGVQKGFEARRLCSLGHGWENPWWYERCACFILYLQIFPGACACLNMRTLRMFALYMLTCIKYTVSRDKMWRCVLRGQSFSCLVLYVLSFAALLAILLWITTTCTFIVLELYPHATSFSVRLAAFVCVGRNTLQLYIPVNGKLKHSLLCCNTLHSIPLWNIPSLFGTFYNTRCTATHVASQMLTRLGRWPSRVAWHLYSNPVLLLLVEQIGRYVVLFLLILLAQLFFAPVRELVCVAYVKYECSGSTGCVKITVGCCKVELGQRTPSSRVLPGLACLIRRDIPVQQITIAPDISNWLCTLRCCTGVVVFVVVAICSSWFEPCVRVTNLWTIGVIIFFREGVRYLLRVPGLQIICAGSKQSRLVVSTFVDCAPSVRHLTTSITVWVYIIHACVYYVFARYKYSLQTVASIGHVMVFYQRAGVLLFLFVSMTVAHVFVNV